MALKRKFNPKSVVDKKVKQMQARFEKALLLVLNQLGQELVTCARDMHTYKDQTGNLTNSMNYVIVKGKNIVSMGANGAGTGAEEAETLLRKLALKTTSNYTLIVVAGMNYAAYVQAKGYNVLLPAEMMCNRECEKRIRALVNKFNSKIKGAI
ncbi:MAG: hypothetical protein KBT28_10745 [Bacteroidales bacterium]|nr:hypothetical protein [Candidatus Colimorpha merdihippi]